MPRSNTLEDRLRLFRWRVHGKIGDALHALDKATGSVMERRILCGVLDRLGADGAVAFLNEEPVGEIERAINLFVGEREKDAEARSTEREQIRRKVTPTTDDLLRCVLTRLGQEGRLTLTPKSDHLPLTPVVEVRWQRSYDGVLSDERVVDDARGIDIALKAVLRWEHAADAEEGRTRT